MIPLNKHESIAAITLGITLCILVALFGFIINFSGSGGMHGGGAIGNGPRFAPYIYNQSIVDLSLGFIPPAHTVTLYCTYTLTDSQNRVVDSSLMFHAPFSDEYIIAKTLSLQNGDYTFVINAHYLNGTIYTPTNATIKVDTNVLEPEMTLLSPQAQNYTASQVDIVYCVNSHVEWSYYKLDSQEWVRFYGNTTLVELANGPHQLQVSVKTEANEYSYYSNMAQTVNFDVKSAT
jgi:hypothetical protein